MKPQVTLGLILNYNDAQMTQDLAEKLSRFSQMEHVLIVDNASSDDSLQQLKRIKNPKITVIASPKNGGYAAGNNIGLRYAQAHHEPEFIMIANPDIDLDEATFDQCLNHLKSAEATIACVAPKMILKTGKMNTAWKLPTYASMMLTAMLPIRPFLSRWISYPASALTQDTTHVDVLAGSLIFARFEALKKIGYYDERTFLFGEENILAHKLIHAGYQSVLLNRLTYLHLHSFSINKNLPKIRDKFLIALNSDLIYLQYYLKVSSFQRLLYRYQYRLGLTLFLGMKSIKSVLSKNESR